MKPSSSGKGWVFCRGASQPWVLAIEPFRLRASRDPGSKWCISRLKDGGNHAVQFYSGPLWPPKRPLFFLRVWMPRLLGDFRGIPAGLSLRLFVLGTRSVWVLFPFLSPRPECWRRPASQVAHTSKQEGSWLLVFRQTSLTFFVVWGTGGTVVYLQRISPAPPRYRLPPAHRPIPQEPLKATVSQGGGVAFLQKVN